MKHKAGLIVPVLMLVFGAYALLTALGTGGEQVTLISDLPGGWSSYRNLCALEEKFSCRERVTNGLLYRIA